jgi:hypothetical protein
VLYASMQAEEEAGEEEPEAPMTKAQPKEAAPPAEQQEALPTEADEAAGELIACALHDVNAPICSDTCIYMGTASLRTRFS